MWFKHGLSRSPEYSAWRGIRRRCMSANAPGWHRYGGRGIRICDRWLVFENFLADVGMRPSALHSIDRYPNRDGNYAPGNVRWATAQEQSWNRDATCCDASGTSFVEIARRNGINENTFHARVRIGIDPTEASSKPPIKRGNDRPNSILTEADVRIIRASAETIPSLAKKYAVSPSTIYAVIQRKIWKHVEDYGSQILD